jgi:poly(3-hydroxybutyrate) depolymerase
MVLALRKAGAAGNLFAFGQSNGADWVQRLGVNSGPALPFVGIAPQSGQLNAQPPRSAAGPFNLNQPTQGSPPVAQLSIHGTKDRTISYQGGPKFHSPVFIMYSEPDSNRAWAQHNGCGANLTVRNVSAEFSNKGNHSAGISTRHAFNGCPPAAPVEWYETHGAGHVGTITLNSAPVLEVVISFFLRVEKAVRAA